MTISVRALHEYGERGQFTARGQTGQTDITQPSWVYCPSVLFLGLPVKLLGERLDRLQVNAKSTNGLTALQQAAAEGHTEAADLLLSAGAAVDACALSNATALYNAANGGHLAIIERLLRAGADVDAKTSGGCTPLHAAASGGHTEASPLSGPCGLLFLWRSALCWPM